MDGKCWFAGLLLFLSGLAGCAVLPGGDYSAEPQPAGAGQPYVLWMLSDIQPPGPAERVDFERAIDDVNARVAQVDLGVMAGDLLASRSPEEAFSWFVDTRKRSKVVYWYEIAGNHDVRSGRLFRQFFPRPPYYAVEVGNILLLFLSDQSRASATEISGQAFSWWRDMVLGGQDRIIITVTHGQLQNSGLLGSSLASRVIAGSERFEAVLRQARVAIWASGHSHLPHGLPGTVSVQRELGGTCFINVSSIDTRMLLASQSRFFIFREGADTVLIRSRNHGKGRFDAGLDVVLPLDRPFAGGERKPRVIVDSSMP